MNNPAITKEDLLKIAFETVKRDGLENLNIRLLAKECNISVGCIYNYFTSKSELIFAIIEKFWYTVIDTCAYDEVTSDNFIEFISAMYNRLYLGLKEFTSDFLNQMSILSKSDKSRGKKIEADYLSYLKFIMLQELDKDNNISSVAWTDTLTNSAFVDFVFANMMMSLRKGDKDCAFLIELIRRSIYK